MTKLNKLYSISTTIGTYFMSDYGEVTFENGRYKLYKNGELVVEINPMYVVAVEYEQTPIHPEAF